MDEGKLQKIKEEYLERCDKVDYSITLPDTETEVMLALWRGKAPFNTASIMKLIGENRSWKLSTLISFLSRLEEKGFIMSYKEGKERYYIPLAERDEYVSRLTHSFFEKYHDCSLPKLLDALYSDRAFSDEDIDGLIMWLEKRRDG